MIVTVSLKKTKSMYVTRQQDNACMLQKKNALGQMTVKRYVAKRLVNVDKEDVCVENVEENTKDRIVNTNVMAKRVVVIAGGAFAQIK